MAPRSTSFSPILAKMTSVRGAFWNQKPKNIMKKNGENDYFSGGAIGDYLNFVPIVGRGWRNIRGRFTAPFPVRFVG